MPTLKKEYTDCKNYSENIMGEISKILDVSVNTVKVHVSSIIQKLGVEDRTQVVVKAFKDKMV